MPLKIPCKVADVICHDERVYSVLLKPEMQLPRFAAGQFLHLALDPFQPGDFWPESRAFSIASSPSERELLRITYAVKGKYTSRMEQELHIGREVWIKLPYGDFTVDLQSNVCLLAGGTGITAFTAFLRELPADHPHAVELFYGARCAELLIYRLVAEEFAQRCRDGEAFIFIEQAEATQAGLLQGRVDIEQVWKRLPEPGNFTYYVAGPPEMIRALTAGLKTKGIMAGRIVIDAWD